jgi:hypothetical protein
MRTAEDKKGGGNHDSDSDNKRLLQRVFRPCSLTLPQLSLSPSTVYKSGDEGGGGGGGRGCSLAHRRTLHTYTRNNAAQSKTGVFLLLEKQQEQQKTSTRTCSTAATTTTMMMMVMDSNERGRRGEGDGREGGGEGEERSYGRAHEGERTNIYKDSQVKSARAHHPKKKKKKKAVLK